MPDLWRPISPLDYRGNCRCFKIANVSPTRRGDVKAEKADVEIGRGIEDEANPQLCQQAAEFFVPSLKIGLFFQRVAKCQLAKKAQQQQRKGQFSVRQEKRRANIEEWVLCGWQ
jgi:hypothetical protein